MKKPIFILTVILTSTLLSFIPKNEVAEEITITVTSEKPVKFDMFQGYDGSFNRKNGLVTPYELKISGDAKFIFKSLEKGTSIKVKAERSGMILTADWSITVLLIEGRQMSTFGMD